MNFNRARNEVRQLIRTFQSRRASHDPRIAQLTRGKLYELFVLSRLLLMLHRRGFSITLNGTVLTLKQAPGIIKPGDTYFELQHPASRKIFRVYTDIQVRTLGSSAVPVTDLCGHHEIDIVVVDADAVRMPSHRQLALGVECKSNADFRKSILKEVLGIRRELSLRQCHRSSILAKAARNRFPKVPANPASEYYVCYLDRTGDRYSYSPQAFGIEFVNLRP